MAKIDPARPLNDDENAILRLLLQLNFNGVEKLRAQAEGARAVWRCDCGCPTIKIEVHEDAPSAPLRSRLSPVELRVSSEGEEPGGEIILFLKDGRLSSMEYVWYTDKPPDRWPSSDRLTALEIER